jgi:hypothetical protein
MYDFIFKNFELGIGVLVISQFIVPARAEGGGISTGSLLLIFILLGAYFVCNILLCLAIANCPCTKKILRSCCKVATWIQETLCCGCKILGCKKKRRNRVHIDPLDASGVMRESDMSTVSQAHNQSVVMYVIENSYIHTLNESSHSLDVPSGPVIDDALCIICMEKKKDVLFQPCKHICLCYGCSLDLFKNTNLCPLCRLPIKRIEPNLV